MQLPLLSIVLSLVSLALFPGCAAPDSADGDDLSSDDKILSLLEFRTKYNRIARPPPDYNSTNSVCINLIVLKLLNIDEVAQHMFLEGLTVMEWTDRRLAWEGKFNKTFDNVPNIYLPRREIWTPDVITMNTVEHTESKWQQQLSSIVFSSGRIFTSTPFSTRTLCDINMLYFPFDSQTCKVIFGSWHMAEGDLELKVLNSNTSSVTTDTDRQINIESDEFCITGKEFAVTPMTDDGDLQEAVFTISLQRKPLFYVINLIVPSFLILIISVFSVFVPPESGERLSLNITLMLALTVFMQIVVGYTPAQSDHVPMLTRFFTIVVIIAAGSTLGSMFQLYCHFKGHASPTVDYALIRAVFFCSLGDRKSSRDSRSNKDGFDHKTDHTGCAEETLHPSTMEAADLRQSEPQESEWHTLGRRLDVALFVVMALATAALALFISLIRNPSYVAC